MIHHGTQASGSRTRQMVLRCLVALISSCTPKSDEVCRVSHESISTWVGEIRQFLAEGKVPDEDGATTSMWHKPPKALFQLIRAGPCGVEAIYRLWAETGDWYLLETWEPWFREAAMMGFLDYMPSLLRGLTLPQGKAVEERLLLVVSSYEYIGDDEDERNLSDEPDFLRLRSSINGRFAVLNPIVAYEEACGAGSWPKDLPVERLVAPKAWKGP